MDRIYKMSEKEIIKTQVMNQLEKKAITQRMAAEQLGISIRHVKRLSKIYQERGLEGLINKSRGKPSHNQLREEVKKSIVNLILEKYRDFGPTLATEKLVELHGIKNLG